MTIKALLEDSGVPQSDIRYAFKVPKATVWKWTHIKIPDSKYNMIKGYLVAKARLFINKYDK